MTQDNPVTDDAVMDEAPAAAEPIPQPHTLGQQLKTVFDGLIGAARTLDAANGDQVAAEADLQAAQTNASTASAGREKAHDGFVAAANKVIYAVTELRDSA